MKTLSRGLSVLALLAWGSLLVYFYHSGRLNECLIPTYRPLVAVSGYALLALAATLGWALRQGSRGPLAGGLITEDAADELASPGRVRAVQFLAFGVLVVPLWASAVSGDGFSASTVRNRGVVTSAAGLPGKPANLPAPAAPSSVSEPPLPGETPLPNDAATGGNLAADAAQYIRTSPEGNVIAEVTDLLFSADDESLRGLFDGRKVEVVGQFLPVKDSPTGRFQMVRMFMQCCAADARPIAVQAERIPAGSGKAEEMQWAKVVGKLTFPVEDGRRMPLIKTEKLTPCQPPGEAMLY